jgi:hypothetical protein
MPEQDQHRPHDSSTCFHCRNAELPPPEPDHIHQFDSAVGVSCYRDAVLDIPILMLQCACGWTTEIEGILHPDNPPNPNVSGEELEKLYRENWIATAVDDQFDQLRSDIRRLKRGERLEDIEAPVRP